MRGTIVQLDGRIGVIQSYDPVSHEVVVQLKEQFTVADITAVIPLHWPIVVDAFKLRSLTPQLSNFDSRELGAIWTRLLDILQDSEIKDLNSAIERTIVELVEEKVVHDYE